MSKNAFEFQQRPNRPFVIAGPCMAENFELMDEVATKLKALSEELGFDYIFKASFDKANRTSIGSYRGPGWATARPWFEKIKEKHGVPILTDIHETVHVNEVAEVCDVLQIPAFLCRQTDLLVSAVNTGRAVNIKKGQFLAPENTRHIVKKAEAIAKESNIKCNVALTERGTTFGYGNLVVDMRGFKTMFETGVATIFDVTHSLQLPAAGGASGEVSSGLREFAPVLARAAVSTGYVSGLFVEAHTNPNEAKSDAATQLNLEQTEILLRQLIPMLKMSNELAQKDDVF